MSALRNQALGQHGELCWPRDDTAEITQVVLILAEFFSTGAQEGGAEWGGWEPWLHEWSMDLTTQWDPNPHPWAAQA